MPLFISRSARKKLAKAQQYAAEKASRAEAQRLRQEQEGQLLAALERRLRQQGSGGGDGDGRGDDANRVGIGGGAPEGANCSLCYVHCNTLRELARHALGERHRRRAEVEALWEALKAKRERQQQAESAHVGERR